MWLSVIEFPSVKRARAAASFCTYFSSAEHSSQREIFSEGLYKGFWIVGIVAYSEELFVDKNCCIDALAAPSLYRFRVAISLICVFDNLRLSKSILCAVSGFSLPIFGQYNSPLNVLPLPLTCFSLF